MSVRSATCRGAHSWCPDAGRARRRLELAAPHAPCNAAAGHVKLGAGRTAISCRFHSAQECPVMPIERMDHFTIVTNDAQATAKF